MGVLLRRVFLAVLGRGRTTPTENVPFEKYNLRPIPSRLYPTRTQPVWMTPRCPHLLVYLACCLALVVLSFACTGSNAAKLSKEQFQEADIRLRRTAEAAERGDVNQAEIEFQRPHAFLHSLDLPLRNQGEEDLANILFDLKNRIEVEFAGNRRADVIAQLARDIRALLPRAATAMGAKYQN